MARLEVENRVSLYSHPRNAARWNIKGDEGQIVLYLGSQWDEAETVARNEFIETQSKYPRWQDLVLTNFIGILVFEYLMERICLERAHEKIRMKRDKCHPCVVKGITNKMFNHIINLWRFE